MASAAPAKITLRRPDDNGLTADPTAEPPHLRGATHSRPALNALQRVAVQFVSGPIPLASPSPPTLPNWPAMMSRAQLCDYLGVSWTTLKAILTVPPVDLGANVVRYRRDQIDEWVKSRPPRRQERANPSPPIQADRDESSPDARLSALDRARQRAGGRS